MSHERIVVLGASGETGRLVVAALAARGFAVVAAGRSRTRTAAALGDLAAEVELEEVDLTEPGQVRGIIADAAVVVTAVGPFDALGRVVLAAAIDAGVAYVDTAGEQPFVAWARATQHERAVAAGVTAVPGGGAGGVPGDLLAALAGERVEGPCEVHVAYAFPRGLWRTASAGTRRSLATLVGAPVLATVEGRLVEERLAEHRRLAWFPRPVGPRHAAAVPGLEPLSVPDHRPDARVVRTYLSLSTPGSEALQFLGNLARWQPARDRLRSLLGPGPASTHGPSADVRAASRWACVAEVATDAAVGRAWSYGTDPHGLSAAAATAVVERLVAGTVPAGVVAPALVGPPGELLDRIAATTDLRWGRAVSERPTATRR